MGQLTTSDLFGQLGEEEVKKLLDQCERREYDDGDIIFTENDLGDELYIVEEGSVRISKSVSLEADHTLGVAYRGAIFGEMAVLESSTRSATATAQNKTVLLALTAEDFDAIVSENADTGLKVLRSLTKTIVNRLRTTNDLLSETVAWGLEISGASGMSFQSLMTNDANLRVSMSNGRTVSGRLIKVDRSDHGLELLLRDPGESVHIIPYHAIVEMIFGVEVITGQAPQAAESEEV